MSIIFNCISDRNIAYYEVVFVKLFFYLSSFLSNKLARHVLRHYSLHLPYLRTLIYSPRNNCDFYQSRKIIFECLWRKFSETRFSLRYFPLFSLDVILYNCSLPPRSLHTSGPAAFQRLNAESMSLESRPTVPLTHLMIALFCSCAWSKAIAEKGIIVLWTTKLPQYYSLYTLRQTNSNFIKLSTWKVTQHAQLYGLNQKCTF